MIPARLSTWRSSAITPRALVELDRLAVEQLQRLAGAPPAHVEAAVDLRQVERVRRPAQLEHHVVGDVHQRRIGRRPERSRRRASSRALRRARSRRGSRGRRSARTVGRVDAHLQPIGDRTAAGSNDGSRSGAPVSAATSRAMPSTEAMRQVGRELEREHVSSSPSTSRPAAHRRRGQHQQPAWSSEGRARAPSTACRRL